MVNTFRHELIGLAAEKFLRTQLGHVPHEVVVDGSFLGIMFHAGGRAGNYSYQCPVCRKGWMRHIPITIDSFITARMSVVEVPCKLHGHGYIMQFATMPSVLLGLSRVQLEAELETAAYHAEKESTDE